jgi:glycosyltransferase involved in cell wall biosynthesis
LLQGGRAAAPSISLVTSVFNGREYLERCIDSILSQGYPNLEYIILDGGSTDGTQEIIKKYERYLAFWRSTPDNGHYSAVQDGLTRSTGSIMSWLNADDRLTPYSLDLVAAIFTGAKEIEWLTGRQCISAPDNSLDIGGVPRLTGEDYFNDGFDSPFIQQEGTFWRRSLWERAGGALDVRLELAADMELWTRFFQHAHPYTTSVPLGIFQMRPGQRSEVFRNRYFNEAYRVIQRLKVLGIKPFHHPEPEATRLPIPVEPD